jgi:polyhydroxyalkanoate synthesis regulator phasin
MDDKASRMRDEEELATRRELEAAEDHVAQLRSRLTAKASR